MRAAVFFLTTITCWISCRSHGSSHSHTTAAPNLSGVATVCLSSSSLVSIGGGISAISMRNDTHAAVKIQGPSMGWFGIGFGSVMIGSTAWVRQQNSALWTYDMAGKMQNEVTRSGSQGFTVLSSTVSGSHRTICVIRPVCESPKFGSASLNVIWAQGAATTVQHHDTRGTGSLSVLGSSTCVDHSGHGTAATGHAGHTMNGCVMNMLFHFSTTECVLFEGWKITNGAQFVLSWFGLFFMVFIRELLVLIQRWPRLLRYIASTFGAKQDPSSNKILDVEQGSYADWALTMWDAFWYAMNVLVGYIIMLVFMTFNVGLCSAIVVGFFFSRAFLQRKVGYLTRLKNKQGVVDNANETQAGEMTNAMDDDCCNVPPGASETRQMDRERVFSTESTA